jgi:hypothetical protein
MKNTVLQGTVCCYWFSFLKAVSAQNGRGSFAAPIFMWFT